MSDRTGAEGDEGPGDAESEAPEALRQRLFGWMSISVAAFIMSATATGINIYYAFQGSEIAIQEPDSVLLYRDGEGEAAVLSVAMRIEAVNTAGGYGDVVQETSLSVGNSPARFAQQGQASPTFSANADELAGKCGLGQSCVANEGLVVVQRSDEIMDLAGGSAKAFTPFYWLVNQNCEGSRSDCRRWKNFTAAAPLISGRAPEFRMHVRLQEDGERTITCVTRQIDFDYLESVGWTQIPCVETRVEGAPLF